MIENTIGIDISQVFYLDYCYVKTTVDPRFNKTSKTMIK